MIFNKKLPTKETGQSGYTLVEIMIATSIFAGILIICLTALTVMSRIYFKGVSEAKAQATARNILANVIQTIQSTGAGLIVFQDGAYDQTNSKDSGWRAYCIGGVKYSYRLNYQLDPEALTSHTEKTTKALIAKQTENVECKEKITSTGGVILSVLPSEVDPVGDELLAHRMRLTKFDIDHSYDHLYSIDVTVVYGGDPNEPGLDGEVFKATTSGTIPTPGKHSNTAGYDSSAPSGSQNIVAIDYKKFECNSGQSFCAVANLATKVYQRIR